MMSAYHSYISVHDQRAVYFLSKKPDKFAQMVYLLHKMFIDLFLKSIPRSWQAAVALVVMLATLGRAMSLMPVVFLGVDRSVHTIIVFVVCLLVGIPAAIAYYYFQGRDSNPDAKQYKSLETLNQAYENDRKRQALAQGAKPAFPELHEQTAEEHRRNVKAS